MTDSIPVPQPPLTPEHIAVGKDVEIRRLTARVRELEQDKQAMYDEAESVAGQALERLAALTQAHQQAVRERDTLRVERLDRQDATTHLRRELDKLQEKYTEEATMNAPLLNAEAGYRATIASFKAQLQQAVEALAGEQRACINDVCMYCANRARGYCEAQGPNSAGNWTHQPADGKGGDVLCRATGIMSRKHYNAALASVSTNSIPVVKDSLTTEPLATHKEKG